MSSSRGSQQPLALPTQLGLPARGRVRTPLHSPVDVVVPHRHSIAVPPPGPLAQEGRALVATWHGRQPEEDGEVARLLRLGVVPEDAENGR